MHPLTAVSISLVTSPYLWEAVHAAPQSRLINREVTASSPPEKFDYPACVQRCEASDHGKAKCTDVCQRLLPCWMYCNQEFKHDGGKKKHCISFCVDDMKNATSLSARFDATSNIAHLRPAFPETLLAGRDTTKACTEDIDRDVICAEPPRKMVPRNDHDQCNIDCDEIQHSHQAYLCKMNCTNKVSIGNNPPNVHARSTNLDTLESTVQGSQTDAKTAERGSPTHHDDSHCTDYCNDNSSGGSPDEIRDRCSKACITLGVCETACEAQGPNDEERCVVDCVMIGSDTKDGSAVVARDSISQLTSVNAANIPRSVIPRAQGEPKQKIVATSPPTNQPSIDDCTDVCLSNLDPETSEELRPKCRAACQVAEDCYQACKKVDDSSKHLDCLATCLGRGPPPAEGSRDTAITAVSRSTISRAQSQNEESDIAVGSLSKRYSPDQCKFACHEIDDPTGQICYQPCIDAHPGQNHGSIMTATDFVSLNIAPHVKSKGSMIDTRQLNKRYPPDQCKFACHEIDDPTGQICYQPCIDAHPGRNEGSTMTATDFVSLNIMPRVQSEAAIRVTPLDKRYPPDQCKFACHEIDDPTGQICYQPCIDAHPGQNDGSFNAAADFVSQEVIPQLHEKDASDKAAAVILPRDIKRSTLADMPNHQGINISSPIITAEDLDRCTRGCVAYAEADSYLAPGNACLRICLGAQACQSKCAPIEDHEENIICGIDCFMTACQDDSIDCTCATAKGDLVSSSNAECRIGPPTVSEDRVVRDVHADPEDEGASRLREMSLAGRGDQVYDGPSTTITFGDFPTPSTTDSLADFLTMTDDDVYDGPSTTITLGDFSSPSTIAGFPTRTDDDVYDGPSTTTTSGVFPTPSTTDSLADFPTMTVSEWVPSTTTTMSISVSAGSSLGCRGWQVVWAVVLVGVAGGVFLW